MVSLFLKDLCNRHVFYEFAPSVVFLLVNLYFDLFTATACLIGATVLVSIWCYCIEKRLPVFPLITLTLVIILGSATIWFNDPLFIKIKPTVGKLLFAGMLGAGVFLQRGLLERAFEKMFRLADKAAWNMLTFRWIGVSIIFAVLNEVIWRNCATDTWVLWTTIDTPISIFILINITRNTIRTIFRQEKYQ